MSPLPKLLVLFLILNAFIKPIPSFAQVLEKTWYSYLTRESGDIQPSVNYETSSWSAEIALDFDAANFIGDYGEFFRQGVSANTFNYQRSGWSIYTDHRGYGASDKIPVIGLVSDGKGNFTMVGSGDVNGRLHIVMTFNSPTKTLSFYINGTLVSTSTNASLSLPSQMGGELSIGARNKLDALYSIYPSNAMPRMNVYFARIWSKDLMSSEVATIYSDWSTIGKPTVPAGISSQLVNAFYMDGEVADKNGSPGSGWIKDSVGGNHLKIVDSAGGKGPISKIFVPSGTIRGVSPANNATGVSGAAALVADGVVGSSKPLSYFFEIDDNPSFSISDLERRDSGWMPGKPEWKPLMKPNAMYYWRVKVRDSQTVPIESSWSPTYSLTTRSPTNWYVRNVAPPATYGLEDGTSYDNAWNGLRLNGSMDSISFSALKSQADLNKVAPGDTVYVTGDWGLMTSSDFSLRGTDPQVRLIKARGLSEQFPIYIRFDHPQYPLKLYKMFRYTGNYSWTNEGNGIYSTASFYNAPAMAVDVAGRPDININDPNSDTLLYPNSNLAAAASPGFYFANSKMYVRMPDGASPGNRLWYLMGTSETYGFNIVSSKFVRFVGGEFYGTAPNGFNPGSESTYLYFDGLKIKYNPSSQFAFQIGDFTDNWTFDNVEISYVQNGIYGTNTGDPATRRTGDFITVKRSYIHNIGLGPFLHKDAHAVGFQSGNNWTIEDNLFEHTGSSIEAWTFDDKETRNHKIRRNVILDVKKRATTFGGGICFTNGNVLAGLRTGIEVTDNVIINTDASGIHSSVSDPTIATGNLIVNSGLGDADYSWNGISYQPIAATKPAQVSISGNVVINPKLRFVSIGGNSASNSAINNNLYFGPSPMSATEGNRFALMGSGFSFTSWQSFAPYFWDKDSRWELPFRNANSNNLPSGFEKLKYDLFLAPLFDQSKPKPGDLNRDGILDSRDLTYLEIQPSISPKEQNPAYVRYVTNQIAISAPPPNSSKPNAPTNLRASSIN